MQRSSGSKSPSLLNKSPFYQGDDTTSDSNSQGLKQNKTADNSEYTEMREYLTKNEVVVIGQKNGKDYVAVWKKNNGK